MVELIIVMGDQEKKAVYTDHKGSTIFVYLPEDRKVARIKRENIVGINLITGKTQMPIFFPKED